MLTLVLGATLGYGSPAVGVFFVALALAGVVAALRGSVFGRPDIWMLIAVVLFGAFVVLLGGLPLWLALLAAVAGGVYWFARANRWWWVGTVPLWGLQIAALKQRWHWGRAAIDVFTTLQTGTEHLLQGANPYVFRYRDLAPLPKWHYVQAPFQYGPAALYLGVPGRLLGDVRLLAAIAVAGTIVALLVAARKHGRDQFQRVAYLAASLPLWIPLIVDAWVDVYTAAGLAIWWALRHRHWPAAAIALGIGAAAKPVMLVGLLPLLVWDRSVRRDVAVAAATGIVLCLPFLVWTGPVNFVYAVAGVHVQVLNEIWPTSVTFNALLLKAHLATIPDVVSILVLLASMPVAALWRPQRKELQLLTAVAFMLAALLLSKQSFLNYYFVVVVWLLLAIAEAPERPPATEPEGEALRVQPALLH
ncbi:MAG TPA: hypothetical protein VF137_09920 [Candidatus Dormibacteraeota bacterium]